MSQPQDDNAPDAGSRLLPRMGNYNPPRVAGDIKVASIDVINSTLRELKKENAGGKAGIYNLNLMRDFTEASYTGPIQDLYNGSLFDTAAVHVPFLKEKVNANNVEIKRILAEIERRRVLGQELESEMYAEDSDA